ncbi:uncharacterized protein Rab39 isoform X2 [Dermacentor albipictus]|uniref:uncharacterized protein Rab39 isoform X2 n=1 Tax=Dermacentor albipictus TaxID=60249 RepID=UPI0038FBE917
MQLVRTWKMGRRIVSTQLFGALVLGWECHAVSRHGGALYNGSLTTEAKFQDICASPTSSYPGDCCLPPNQMLPVDQRLTSNGTVGDPYDEAAIAGAFPASMCPYAAALLWQGGYVTGHLSPDVHCASSASSAAPIASQLKASAPNEIFSGHGRTTGMMASRIFLFIPQAPLVLMSDNSRPEKDALKKAWPAAEQLLCQFHVLQAEWRWLTAAGNKVPKEDRRQLMAAFQKILYAKDKSQLEAAKEHLRTVGHEGYVHGVEAFLCCEKEWVQMYRRNLATKGHNTNNYSEASIRILKDVVLCRTKAYNAVALVEIIVSTWEKYFETRLLRHAHHREASRHLTFEHRLQDLPELPAGSVTKSGETYYVPSSSSNATYQVQADVGICTCWVGSQGGFCKHQAAVQRAFGGCFPNSPKLTPADCKQLGQLALGERFPPLDFFLPMRPAQDNAPSEPIEDEFLNMVESASGAPLQQQPWQIIAPNSCPQPGPSTTPDFCPQPGPSTAPDFCPQPGPSTAPDFCAQPEDTEETYTALERALRRMHKLAEGNPGYGVLLRSFKKRSFFFCCNRKSFQKQWSIQHAPEAKCCCSSA